MFLICLQALCFLLFQQGLEILQKHGLTLSQKALSSKTKELRENCDAQVYCWKEQCVFEKEKVRLLSKLKESLIDLAYLPKLSTVTDVEQYLKDNFTTKEDILESNVEQSLLPSENEFKTLDTSELNLCFDEPEPHFLLNSICSSLDTNKAVVCQLLKDIVDSALGCNGTLLEVIEHMVQNFTPAIPYQLVGDNVDLDVKVRHMDKDNKNKSLHFFNLIAFEDLVTGNELPDTHTKTLADVPISSFLPTALDLVQLKRDFIILMSRIIVKHFKDLSFFKSCAIYHTPHKYEARYWTLF